MLLTALGNDVSVFGFIFFFGCVFVFVGFSDLHVTRIIFFDIIKSIGLENGKIHVLI